MPPSAYYVRICRIISQWAGVFSVATGCLVLAGWQTNTVVLKSILPDLPVMVPITAALFILSGLALSLRQSVKLHFTAWLVSSILALSVLAGGSTILLEYVLGWDSGIDFLIFPDLLRQSKEVFPDVSPGRASPNTALCFFFLGISILAVGRKNENKLRVSQFLSLISAAISLVALAGYGFEITALYARSQLLPFIGMALPTAVGILVLSIGILCLYPERGLMAIVVSSSSGGVLIRRRLFLAIFVIPVILIGATLTGHHLGSYVVRLLSSTLTVIGTLLFVSLAWGSAIKQEQLELTQKRSDDILRQSEQQQRFLAEVSGTLSESLDYEMTLSKISKVVIPKLGDWCIIRILSHHHLPRATLGAHVDPSRDGWVKELSERYSPDPRFNQTFFCAIQTGEPVIIPEVSDKFIRSLAQDSKQFELLQRLGMRSYIAIPLISRGKTLGGISAVYSESNRRYSPNDLSLAREIGYRSALAIDNARLYLEAQIAIKGREEIIAIVSHDLKNPLSAVITSSEILSKRKEIFQRPDAVQKVAENVRNLAEVMRKLIDDLLDFAKIESGRLPLRPQAVRLLELIRQANELFAPLIIEKSLRIDWNTHDTRDIDNEAIVCDQHRILQVLSNIVGNAIKFSPRGGTIVIRAASDQDSITFSVTDSGPGISAEELIHVFERFWQAPKTAHIGIGLGLSIAKNIIESHGGKLWAESKVGEGSTFHFTLPRDAGAVIRSAA